jgi:ABC-type nitrate/sulfonate/bicarbonate transport system permease component
VTETLDTTPASAGRKQIPTAALTYGLLALLAALWEAVVAAGLVDARFISKPSQVVSSLVTLGQDPEVRQAMADTLYAVGVSFVIGAGLGLVLGMAIGLSRTLRAAYLPFVVLLLGIPKSVFLPLFILFFGLGVRPGIAFGVVLCSIQVIVNVIGGIDSIDDVHYKMAKAYGAGPVKLFRNVILPGAAPGIFAGMWHGIRNAFIGVVIAQLFVSNIGVGYLVRVYSSNFRIDDALALVFFIAFVVILVGTAWERFERRLSGWKEPVGPAAQPASA